MAEYDLNINGNNYRVEAAPLTPLVAVLRDRLGMTGTKIGCFEGRCGACTVMVGRRSVTSCLLPIFMAVGEEIRTVEGLAPSVYELSPLQEAILDSGGVQCGICTPGILMTLTALLEESGPVSAREVQEALAGNLCRCTGYHKIVEAALAAASNSRNYS